VKHASLLLHFYQPPTQKPEVVREIDRECYAPLFGMLRRTGAPVTVNISWSLTEHLLELGPGSLDDLAAAPGVEFTSTAAWHPILPLLDPVETARQTAFNCLGNGRVLRERFRPSGFYPPEMAFDRGLAGTLAGMGYAWTVTDDLPWTWSGREAPYDWIPECGGIRVFLRSNFWSNLISFHGGDGAELAGRLVQGMEEWCGPGDAYTLIAMDGETFGHHRKDGLETFLEPFLRTMMSSRGARLSTLGEVCGLFPSRTAEVPAGTWSATAADLEEGIRWPLWDNPVNASHRAMWELLRLVLAAARSCGSERVAELADRMLYSCPFWWASKGRENPEQVRRGVESMIRTARAVAEYGDKGPGFLARVTEIAGGIPAITGKGD
jgi:hypothetical protein